MNRITTTTILRIVTCIVCIIILAEISWNTLQRIRSSNRWLIFIKAVERIQLVECILLTIIIIFIIQNLGYTICFCSCTIKTHGSIMGSACCTISCSWNCCECGQLLIKLLIILLGSASSRYSCIFALRNQSVYFFY
jgi:hypothetical protein